MSKWIRCGDGLPKADVDVLVYDKYDGYKVAYYDDDDGQWRMFNYWEEFDGCLNDVVAWTPIPQYEDGGESNGEEI